MSDDTTPPFRLRRFDSHISQIPDLEFDLDGTETLDFFDQLNDTDMADVDVCTESLTAPDQQGIGNDAATSLSIDASKEEGLGDQDAEEGDKAEDDEGDDEEPKRELRPQARQTKGRFTTTWLDQDDTGDFDPSEENRQAYHRRNRTRLMRLRGPTCQAKSHSKRGATYDEVRDQLIVTLGFQSDFSKNRFAELVRNIPVQPPPPDRQPGTNGYSLRKRSQDIEFTYNDNYDRKRQRFGAEDIPEDPTGHPFARGCWACVALGDNCSLLDNEASWPCATCIADNTECDLVIPPRRKRACERCKKRKIPCSYSYTLNHGIACQQCMEDEYNCLAGPAKDFIRSRARYPGDGVQNPIRVKKPKLHSHSTCADCHVARRKCSFETDGNFDMGSMPCTQCIENNNPCAPSSNFVPQYLTKVQRSEPEKNATEEPPAKPAEVQQAPPAGPQPPREGKWRTINTKFCHPIIFNHNDRAPGQPPCHFCADPVYRLLGLQERQVRVIDWNDGRGLEELSGGHRDLGVENTRMCPSCTSDRVTVIFCQGHKMEQIPGQRSNSETSVKSALEDLFSGKTDKSKRWCAICPTPASHQCCSPGEEGVRGCGLALCQDCARTLKDAHGGDLQVMLSSLRDVPSEQRQLGLRADYELLKQDGLLFRYVLSG